MNEILGKIQNTKPKYGTVAETPEDVRVDGKSRVAHEYYNILFENAS